MVSRRGRPRSIAFALVAFGASAAALLPGRPAHSGSVAQVTIPLERVVALSARIVEGKVIGSPSLRFEGQDFHSLEVRVESALKGTPARAGETVRIFDPGEWFQHTHAAAIKGGVVSYADTRYASPVSRGELQSGTPLLFFLAGDAPPAGFPAGAAFLVCAAAYERADRGPEVARVRTAAFGQAVTLKVGDRVLLPEGLAIEVKGQSHKRPMVQGPRREMAEVLVTRGRRSQVLELPHDVAPDGKESWGKRAWDGYELELVSMTPDSEVTVRVRRAGS